MCTLVYLYLFSNHQGSAPVAGHAYQPQFSNCSNYNFFIDDYFSNKSKQLFNFDRLTLRHKQFLFMYFYETMYKIQQNLGNRIPRSIEHTEGYRQFELNYV